MSTYTTQPYAPRPPPHVVINVSPPRKTLANHIFMESAGGGRVVNDFEFAPFCIGFTILVLFFGLVIIVGVYANKKED